MKQVDKTKENINVFGTSACNGNGTDLHNCKNALNSKVFSIRGNVMTSAAATYGPLV